MNSINSIKEIKEAEDKKAIPMVDINDGNKE